MAKNVSESLAKSAKGFVGALPTIVPIALFAAVGFIGYKIYNKFFGDSPLDAAENAAKAVGLTDATSRTSQTANTLTQMEADLKRQGWMVSVIHQGNANQLAAMMDTNLVDHAALLQFVNSMGKETFQLTAIAYGQRSLNTYHAAITHIFEASSWTDLFIGQKLYGGLKFHLQTVLSSSEYQGISVYTNSIP